MRIPTTIKRIQTSCGLGVNNWLIKSPGKPNAKKSKTVSRSQKNADSPIAININLLAIGFE
jgi:hypothetical protein